MDFEVAAAASAAAAAAAAAGHRPLRAFCHATEWKK